MQDADILSSDVKALLILLLLKTGTSAEEISTALQMAATSRLVGSQDRPAKEPTPETAEDIERHLAETAKLRAAAPKPVLRTVQQATIKGYAA